MYGFIEYSCIIILFPRENEPDYLVLWLWICACALSIIMGRQTNSNTFW